MLRGAGAGLSTGMRLFPTEPAPQYQARVSKGARGETNLLGVNESEGAKGRVALRDLLRGTTVRKP
jgi:hypothetical protein